VRKTRAGASSSDNGPLPCLAGRMAGQLPLVALFFRGDEGNKRSRRAVMRHSFTTYEMIKRRTGLCSSAIQCKGIF
jgi:hypothetical protein